MSGAQRKAPPARPYAWCFYHIQGEKGESAAHPNAFRVPRPAGGGPVTLRDVVDAFPLLGTGSFHFRFQAPSGKFYLDVINPSDRVPFVGENIQAKVLRMDKLECAAQRALPLPLGTPKPCFRVQADPAPTQRPASQFAGRAQQPTHPAREAEDPDLMFGEQEGDEEDLVVPDHVDADLADKSAFVQAKVMARRNKLKEQQAQRVAAVKAAEAAKAKAEADRSDAKSRLETRLREWSGEKGHEKDVRALLSTLHNVMWADSNWKPAPMAQLVDPKRVKLNFMKACRVVHPDKHNTMEPDQKFVATYVFHALESAYRRFQASELPS